MDSASADEDDDVQIIKVVKKPVAWVSSSFGDFGFEPTASQKSSTSTKTSTKAIQQEGKGYSDFKSLKRPRESFQRSNRPVNCPDDQSIKAAPSSDLWLEKHKPRSRSDLAVHKKKVEVIVDWLIQSSQPVKKHKAPILLLTGPPGAGKTACIHVLCTELGVDVQEWASTSEQAVDHWSESDIFGGEKSRVDVYTSQSQSSLFHNFLLRANKYRALDLFGPKASPNKQATTASNSHNKGQKNVIVVEDIPNIFFREVLKFHDILRNYHYSGHCPVVFIVSESNNNSCSTQKLFPKDLQLQLKITSISLNPVAPTVLVKLLAGIVSKEARLGKFRAPSASLIEAVATSSSGDIRLAINTLQFACRSDTADLKDLCPTSLAEKKRGKGSRSQLKSEPRSRGNKVQSEDTQLSLGAKDTSVFLFHAVGKILYFKRGDPKLYPLYQSLPLHLREHDRDPLLCDPEDVAHKSHLSGDYFNSFLHENYVDFISSVEDLERATKYFSDADYLSSPWAAREELQNYSVSVATRGYIHSNSEFCKHDSSRKTGWRPLHKSQWFSVNKQAAENIVTARQIFKGYHWEPEVLCTEILPFISVTNPTLHDAGQISFVQEMTQFSQSKPSVRSLQERLDERDVVADDEKEENVKTNTESISKPPITLEMDNSVVCEIWGEDGDMDGGVPNSQTKVQDLKYDDDDVVIEDFDDLF